jgi:hypothetical protein
MDYSGTPFMMDDRFFPQNSTLLWTSTASAMDPKEAWAWALLSIPGESQTNLRGARMQVLLASGTPEPPDDRFELIRAGAEVRDRYTGLVWRRCEEGQALEADTCTGSGLSLTWRDALVHVASEVVRTHVAWRMPNLKELSSIFDLSRADPALDPLYFPTAGNEALWSSTATSWQSDWGSSWAVWTLSGTMHGEGHVFLHGMRLVRGPVMPTP